MYFVKTIEIGEFLTAESVGLAIRREDYGVFNIKMMQTGSSDVC